MESNAFLDLYRAHAPQVHRLARYLTGDDDLAADVTSETFLRAWAGRQAIRPLTVRAWLLAIARNLARDEGRRVRRHGGGEPPESAVPPRAEASLELDRALAAIARLPLEYREPLALVAAGLEHEEIARMLGLSRGAVKVRVFRARQKLAAAIAAGKGDQT